MQTPEALLAKLLERADTLPSVPAVAAEVMRVSQREDCSIDALVRVISLDPVLSGRLLKLANSSAAGNRTPVTQLSRAAMLLGMRSVKLMALSCSIVSAFPQDGRGAVDLRALWRRSVVRAVAARAFALHRKSPLADEAFLCGLLSQLGRLVLSQTLPKRYAEVVQRAAGAWPSADDERAVFGFDGAAVGAALLRHWSLPELLCDAIQCASQFPATPAKAEPQVIELAQLVQLAAHCEELVCGRDAAAAMEALQEFAESEHGIDAQTLESLLLDLESGIAETADALELRVQSVRMQEVLEAAQQQIARESLHLASELAGLHQYSETLERKTHELGERATTDALTGIPNRACFDAFLQRCMDEAALASRPLPFGILMLDVDHFKRVNDSYGHPIGDEVLKLVAQTLRKAIRGSEISARYGGEEFAVALQCSRPGLEIAAERLRGAIENAKLQAEAATISVTVSIGGACVEDLRSADAALLMQRADRCLYAAKHSGRNRAVVQLASADE